MIQEKIVLHVYQLSQGVEVHGPTLCRQLQGQIKDLELDQVKFHAPSGIIIRNDNAMNGDVPKPAVAMIIGQHKGFDPKFMTIAEYRALGAAFGVTEEVTRPDDKFTHPMLFRL